MKILLLTSVYKDESFGKRAQATDVVNSFVKEWLKQGHEVIVIHNSHCYPKFVHNLPKSLKAVLATRMSFPIPDFDIVQEKTYTDRGAKIYRLPIKKYVPHQKCSSAAVKQQTAKILAILSEIQFQPDIMVGHWASPQMEIMYELLGHISCKSAIVLHGTGYVLDQKFPTVKYLSRIDRIGCRSKTQARLIQNALNLSITPFVCYSGVPDDYLQRIPYNAEKFDDLSTWKFSYVGRLVKYKRVDVIIKALAQLENKNWHLDIVGDGAEENALRLLAKQLQCSEKITIHGKIPRDAVMSILMETHCFAMVSKGEVFGLVYLEAMAASCITIGSRGEGIDGILCDGDNGFLCEPGDVSALKAKFINMMQMNKQEIKQLAKNGYLTANEYSDSNVARNYLQEITES